MADKTVRGRFVWHELYTPAQDGAHDFYSKVFGWKSVPFEQDPSYKMFAAASGPMSGTVAQSVGTPSWLPYIGTPDIEATVQKATELGATVTTQVTTIPNGGKYALLRDPQGAAFGVYWSAQDVGKEAPAKLGEFSWHELMSSDYQAAFEFYSALFGWDKRAANDMGGPVGIYQVFGRNDNDLGGMFTKSAEMPGPAWVGYVNVKDIEQTVKKVKAARGTLLLGPMDVPGGGSIAQFLDPYGALFAAFSQSSAAGAAREAKPEQATLPLADAANEDQAEAPAAKRAAGKSTQRKAAAKKKAAPVKKAAAKKKTKKKKAAAKAAKRPARKATRKAAAKSKAVSQRRKVRGKKGTKKRAKKGGKKKLATRKRMTGGKKKTAKKPRKGK